LQIREVARIAQIYAVPASEFVRKTIGRFYGVCFGKPSQRARGFAKDVVRDKNIVVGVLAVPAGAAQRVADDLVDAGLRIIFNYSEGLLDVPSDVTVHTSNTAVELLHAPVLPPRLRLMNLVLAAGECRSA
jgi:hypothetical protein